MTRDEFIKRLEKNSHISVVQKHKTKVEQMTEAEFQIHYAKLNENNKEKEAAAARMANELFRKF